MFGIAERIIAEWFFQQVCEWFARHHQLNLAKVDISRHMRTEEPRFDEYYGNLHHLNAEEEREAMKGQSGVAGDE